MNLRTNPITHYFRTSYQELTKVAWPTRQQTLRHSLTVIGVCIFAVIVLGAIDYLLNLGLEALLNRI